MQMCDTGVRYVGNLKEMTKASQEYAGEWPEEEKESKRKINNSWKEKTEKEEHRLELDSQQLL